MTTKHTLTPWSHKRSYKIKTVWVEDFAGETLFEIEPTMDLDKAEALAANVVRRVNAHEALVEALSEILGELPYQQDLNGDCECGEFVDYVPLHDEPAVCSHMRARAALALARGEV